MPIALLWTPSVARQKNMTVTLERLSYCVPKLARGFPGGKFTFNGVILALDRVTNAA
jgi:hypothetical protein